MNINYKGEQLKVNLIDEGQGEVIVFLHGWGASADLYRVIIDVLKRNFRVVAPDFPGFGKSDEPSFAFDTEDYALFVETLLLELGIAKASFIGHSHGGRTVLEIATRKNFSVEIQKLVLIDSAGIAFKKSFKVRAKTALYKTLKALFLTRAGKKLFPEAVESLRKKFGSADYTACSETMRQSMVKVLKSDYTNKLGDIKVPTLLIWGDKDTATPIQCAKLMEKEIPDCGLVTIKGAGHFSFVSDMPLTERVLKSFFNFLF